MNDIFISYSRHDTDVVNEIVTLLEQEGYSIWIDRDGIESGEDFKRVILKAIKESKVVLFFSSEHSNVSDWTAKEIGVAVKYKKHIIPIKLDDSNFNEAVEFDLINLDYIDYSKPSIQTAMRDKLLKTLRNKIGNGSKELERLEAERKAKEEAEQARIERERLERIEAERKAKETKRRAEQERLERERAEAQRKAQQAATTNMVNPSTDTESNPRKGLWIALGAVAMVALVLVLVWPKGHDLNVSGRYKGHDYVDLGLPSGILWAICNLGAIKPEDYGNYYAWGETATKGTYSWNNYRYGNGANNDLTKYYSIVSDGTIAYTDNLTVLQEGDDAATANWGRGWRMPTEEEWEELYVKTSRRWTTRNGVSGMLFTAENGSSIFLPAAGSCVDDEFLYVGEYGYYWSSSGDGNFVSDYFFGSNHYIMSLDERYRGQSVRAVRSMSQN